MTNKSVMTKDIMYLYLNGDRISTIIKDEYCEYSGSYMGKPVIELEELQNGKR